MRDQIKLRLAREFSRTIRDWLTPGQLRTAIALNRTRPPCNTNEFIDSNMAMDHAWRELGLPEMDAACSDQADIWNCAWDIAVDAEFCLDGIDTYELIKALDDRYTRCGLNADWSVSAWHVSGSSEPNLHTGDRYIIDCEDGYFELVERWICDTAGGKYSGMPDRYRHEADGHNDLIRTLQIWGPAKSGEWGFSLPPPGHRISDLLASIAGHKLSARQATLPTTHNPQNKVSK